MNRYAGMVILVISLLLSAGCAWIASSNNNAYRDPLGPDIDEVTGKEMPPGYGYFR
jgi:hypothetical protein